MPADTAGEQFLIKKVITVNLETDTDPETGAPYPWNAGTRVNKVDTMTPFAIPGSGLPPRHCDVKVNITVAVTSTMAVFMSMHDGSIKQNVFGQKYQCRMYVCPHYFKITIPVGSKGWNGVQFYDESGNLIGSDKHSEDCMALLADGRVEKAYDKSNAFDWQFGPCVTLTEGDKYWENEIQKPMPYETTHDGGYSRSDSKFVPVGALTDYGWKKELGDSENGHIYLAGGICYDNATVTDEITAEAVKIGIPGLNMASFYFPGDTQKSQYRESLNRPEGYFKIYKPSFQPEWLQPGGDSDNTGDGWRPIKNTEDDKGVEDGLWENTGFRKVGRSWIRLIITGKGGVPDGEDINGEELGIGADGDDGCCGCCPMKK